jgi:hypothetical protein
MPNVAASIQIISPNVLFSQQSSVRKVDLQTGKVSTCNYNLFYDVGRANVPQSILFSFTNYIRFWLRLKWTDTFLVKG